MQKETIGLPEQPVLGCCCCCFFSRLFVFFKNCIGLFFFCHMQKDVGRMFGGRRERGVQTKLKTENQARRFWLVKGEYIRNLTNIWLYSVGRGNMAAAALSKTEVLLFLCSPLTLLVPTPPL